MKCTECNIEIILNIYKGHHMTDTDTRREEYISLFKTYEMDVDWNFLPGDYIDMPEYKWQGFLHSINMILSRKLSTRNKKQ